MFLPKRSKIFENLVQQASYIQKAAQEFLEITENGKKLKVKAQILEELENTADESVHAINNEIEQTFILPLDKEDLKDLTDSLDDIMDNLEEAANRLLIFGLSPEDNFLKEFASIILKASEQIFKGINLVKEHKFASEDFRDCQIKIHDLEKEGDKLHRKILENLMSGKKEVLQIIKWKEIYQKMEDTLDRCEDIAVLFYRLNVKYR